MQTLEFPSCERLTKMIDDAVAKDCSKATTDHIRIGLSELISQPDFKLPSCVYEAVDDHYARRELYRCDSMGYSVVAMTWGPGQGTPIHDHAGLWCVEGVLHGQIEVVQYALRECDGDRCRFESMGTQIAGHGSAGSLIPPYEYHTIRNISEQGSAISLHIYKSELSQCSTFEPIEGEWYKRCQKQLSLDPAL